MQGASRGLGENQYPSPQPSPGGRGCGSNSSQNLAPIRCRVKTDTLSRRAGEGGGEGAETPDLTYCLNIHPGESWDEQFEAIRTHACAVRERVAHGRLFPLGLRLSAASARTLSHSNVRNHFCEFLRAENLCVFTINAFPYGAFHGARVKDNVYRPDWRTAERETFTRDCAAVLAALLPESGRGSISTVPVGFAPDFCAQSDRDRAMDRLVEMALFLARMESETGRCIHLALEPEPGCVLESCDETTSFFEALYARAGEREPAVRRHIGVCLDTCHAALAFEPPIETWARYRAAGIAVPKVQLSAALEVHGQPNRALARFGEPVYLHQVRITGSGGARTAFNDLPDALAAWPADAECARIHFHVPLFWSGNSLLRTTADLLDAGFWDAVRSRPETHLEIETYTFDVLPPELRRGTVVDSIAREFAWVQSRLTGGNRELY